MKRALKLSLGVAAIGSMVMPNGAHAAINEIARYRLHSDGSTLNLGKLPAGIYDITTIGTYVYDKNTVGPLVADGECSTGSDSLTQTDTVWRDPVDTAMNLTFGPGVLSTWHRWRYGINGDTLLLQSGDPLEPSQLIYTGDILDDTLDVYIKGDVVDQIAAGLNSKDFHGQSWLPTYPSIIDNRDDSLVAGCNLGTHQYDTVIVADGETDVELKVFDTNYVDNLDMKNSDSGPSNQNCATANDTSTNCGLVIQVGQIL